MPPGHGFHDGQQTPVTIRSRMLPFTDSILSAPGRADKEPIHTNRTRSNRLAWAAARRRTPGSRRRTGKRRSAFVQSPDGRSLDR